MLAVAAILLVATELAAGHSCFVCAPVTGGSAEDVRRMFPGYTPRTCDHFDGSSEFVKECPPSSPGCLTQTNGSLVMRTCGNIALNQCQVANGISYCYCKMNLCNGLGRSNTTMPTISSPPRPTDDEDEMEGSGSGRSDHQEDLFPTPVISVTSPTQKSSQVVGSAERTITSRSLLVAILLLTLISDL